MLRVGVIEGNGIGPELIRATKRVLNSTGLEIEWVDIPVGDAAFEALLAYGDEQRVKIIPVALPVLHFVQCTPQGCLKQQGESLRGVESRLQPL